MLQCFVLVGLMQIASAVKGANFDVIVSDDGAYDVLVNGVSWFPGGPTKVWGNGVLYSSQPEDDEQPLSVTGTPTRFSGTDAMGAFDATEMSWAAPGAAAKTAGLITQIKVYEQHIIFEQRAPFMLKPGVAKPDHNSAVTTFPSFEVADLVNTSNTPVRRGALAYDGDMVGSEYKYFEWKKGVESIPGGVGGTAPVVVFTEDLTTSTVISPAYNFMAANQYYEKGKLCYGVLGSVTEIPPGFIVQTIVHMSSGGGVSRAMMEWGDVLMAKYGKDRHGVDYDFTLNYLGYSTDNGAYYYYYTEEDGKANYEDTMIAVHDYAKTVGLPYRHWLADSWWYYKGPHDGVKNWTAMGSIFPHGLDYVTNRTGWPIVGHNRWWSKATDYAKQNGGKYDFLMDRKSPNALPLTQDFWDMLMETSRKWGLYTYEQDWLDNEFDNMEALQQNATLARTWLMQMGSAAQKHGLTIQYCMSHCRHMLASVEIPAVTQARASGDYQQAISDQWKPIGTTAMFAWALGVAPSKDNYWSMQNAANGQTNPRYAKRPDGEPYNRLQAVVSSLSRGPVTPSDQNGKSDVALIMRSCMQDGHLLQLAQPAFALDEQHVQAALGGGGPDGEVWGGYTSVAGNTHYVLLSANLKSEYGVTMEMLARTAGGLAPTPVAVAKEWVAYEANNTDNTIFIPSSSSPLRLSPSDKWTFSYYNIAPVLGNGWALLGEQGKWIAASPRRFSDVTTLETGLVVKVYGSPGEVVDISFLAPNATKPKLVTCTVPQEGSLKVISAAGKCGTW